MKHVLNFIKSLFLNITGKAVEEYSEKGYVTMKKHCCYKNRELSWLDFNKRVLEEAEDKSNPLCERMNFVSIFKSNLDEFFMVRVGSLYDSMMFSGNPKENKTNMTAKEQLGAVSERTAVLTAEFDKAYSSIMKEAEKHGVKLVRFNKLTKKQAALTELYFNNEILPLLSPQIVGKKHPFPFLKNKEIYVLVNLETKRAGSVKIGIIPCNNGVFKRLIPMPGTKGSFMLIEELILNYVSKVFGGYRIKEKAVMRVIRNADIDTDEGFNDDIDYRKTMEKIIQKRKKLCPVKLELSEKISDDTLTYLCSMLNLPKGRTFCSDSPLDLGFISGIQDFLKNKTELFYPPREPQPPMMVNSGESMTAQVKKGDILLSYPYESIKPFIRLLTEAANDPTVVSIKMTLYRVSKFSKIVQTLIEAAENGKEVMVLMELRARFDEENNIEWSKRLEEAGCRIIYGLDHLKVHSKLCLITRKTEASIEYITQIGTGNYNEKTAALYTDYALITASEEIGREAAEVLNELAIGKTIEKTEHLLAAPNCLQNKLLDMIDEEIAKAESGHTAYIGVKVNSVTDKRIIDRLIKASCAGVKIEMIVRGICCLIPGIPEQTENITVRSIVGRYLEHSRVYIFGSGADSRVYISSADFMTRNTLHRVEIAAPIYDSKVKKRILDMFSVMMKDNVKARIQQNNGSYIHAAGGDYLLNSQEYFYDGAYAAADNNTKGKAEEK